MKKYTLEFKVGIFIIFCLLALFYLTYSTGKLDLGKKGYNIFVVFKEVAGLQRNAPVMLNGLEVGKVEDIEFLYSNEQTEIRLKLWLEEGIKVRENPQISIKTLGLMGEKYIQITSIEGSGFLAPDTILIGEPYVDLDKMMATVNTMLDENKDSVKEIVKNAENTSKNFEAFSEDLKRNPWKLLFKTKEKPR